MASTRDALLILSLGCTHNFVGLFDSKGGGLVGFVCAFQPLAVCLFVFICIFQCLAISSFVSICVLVFGLYFKSVFSVQQQYVCLCMFVSAYNEYVPCIYVKLAVYLLV